jgi:carbamoylphosphate synthase large subunit
MHKILVGTNIFSSDWKKCINDINSEHIMFTDLKKNINNLSNYVQQNNIDYIVPLCRKDYDLINKQTELRRKIIFVNNDTHELLHNKIKFNKYMTVHYIKYIPKIFYLNNKIIDNNICYPVIIKPNISVCGKNMYVCKNKNELSRHKMRKIAIMQKFIIDVNEYSAHLFCIDGHIINYKITCQKYDLYNIKSTHFNALCEYVDDFDMTTIGDIIKQLNYSGGCCIDFKMQDGIMQIFEMNPRFGGSVFSLRLFEELITF